MTKNIIVETESGKLEGVRLDGVNVFKGIPYAAPPLGDRRWLRPAPPIPWQGVRPAVSYGNISPQNDSGPAITESLKTTGPQGEDCLFLNVWTPSLQGKRPVLVWIHGGAFSMGAGSQEMFDGSRLATRGDAVIVTINYRLDVFGFLRLNEVTRGAVPSTGNEGLLDQAAALRWVRDNIAAFGGDPANVTVFGESAGAMSIGCLMAMPAARGLFHKAILQSGAASTACPVDEATAIAEEYLHVLGVKSSDVAALRRLPMERLLAGEVELRGRVPSPAGRPRLTLTQPVIDGETLPPPLEAIRNGAAADISLLAGTNQEEWRLMATMDPALADLDEAGLLRRCGDFLPTGAAAKFVAAYRKARPGRSPGELLTAIQTDRVFRVPAIRLLEAQGKYRPAYNYLLTWKSPAMGGKLGACHVLEIGFVFGAPAADFCGSGPAADRLSASVQDAWLAFARTGSPAHPGIDAWPAYAKGRSTMLLGEECRVQKAVFEKERRAWDAVPDGSIGQI